MAALARPPTHWLLVVPPITNAALQHCLGTLAPVYLRLGPRPRVALVSSVRRNRGHKLEHCQSKEFTVESSHTESGAVREACPRRMHSCCA
jgi:hypothetical protein